MVRLAPIFLCLILLLPSIIFTSCNKVEFNKQTIEYQISEIANLQNKAKTIVNDSSLMHLKHAESLIANMSNAPDSLTIENTFQKGYYYLQIGEYDSAANYFQQTIDLIPEEDSRERNTVYYRNAWDTFLALNKLKNSKAIAQNYINKPRSTQNNGALMYAYNNLEIISLRLLKNEEALDYNKKVIQYAKLSDEYDQLVLESSTYASILLSLYPEKLDEAFNLLDSLASKEKAQIPGINRLVFLNRGLTHLHLDQFSSAIPDFKKTVYYTKLINDSINFYDDMTKSMANLAVCYKGIKQYEESSLYFDSASIYAKKTNNLNYLTFISQRRLEIDYLAGLGLNKSIASIQEIIDWQNQIYDNRINEDLLALTAANEKEKELTAEKQKIEIAAIRRNTLYLSSIILLGFFIVIGILIYIQRKLKFEKQGLQMQQRLLRSQMNPHFIFNILYSIQNHYKKNVEEANNYLTKFSRLLRQILENSTMNYVELAKEIDSLKKYLDLQLIRFPNKFKYEIIFHSLAEDEMIYIPPMLIQPFVENSLEHGFKGIDYQGEVEITLTLSNKYLHCQVLDNGVGMNSSNSRKKESFSGKLIANFIEKATKQKVTINDRSQLEKNKSGIVVNFPIPYQLVANE